MSDTARPELPPQVGVPEMSDRASSAPTASSPDSSNTQSEWGEIPEEVLDEWRWIFKGREEGLFDQYAGKHIAVFHQKVWGSSFDPELLREYVALKHQLDPDRLVIAYIDPW